MSELHLSRYRKLLAFVVTAAIIYALRSFGLSADALPQFGLDVFGLSDQLADFLIQYGPPAVAFVAQPNDEGESLWRDWWHWVLGGTAVLVAAIAIVLVL